MTDDRAVAIEIVERRRKPDTDSVGASIVVPNEVRINGQRILVPEGEPITVHDITAKDVVLVTLTVFARRIFVGHEDIDETVTDAVAEAQRKLLAARQKAVTAQQEAAEAIDSAQRELAAAHRALSEATSGKPVREKLQRLGLIDPPADDDATGVSA